MMYGHLNRHKNRGALLMSFGRVHRPGRLSRSCGDNPAILLGTNDSCLFRNPSGSYTLNSQYHHRSDALLPSPMLEAALVASGTADGVRPVSDEGQMPGLIHISYDSIFKCDLHVWTRSQKDVLRFKIDAWWPAGLK